MNSQIETALAGLQTKVIAGLCFIIAFAITFTAVGAFLMVKVSGDARESHAALCAFKSDLETRHASSVKLLHDHPEDPVRVYGLTVPRDQLVQSTQSQQATLDSLGGLSCP